MIETTSRGSFNHDQTGNTFKMADGCGEEASRQKAPNWVYYEANYGPMKKYNVSYRDGKETSPQSSITTKVQKSKKFRLNPQRMKRNFQAPFCS